MTGVSTVQELPIQEEVDIVHVRQAAREVAVSVGFSLVDQTKVVTAASELARNTLQHGGGGVATVGLERTANHTTLQLVFRDDGPGIPEAELERVFEPFYRLESSRNRATGGTGLGLSIARDVAQAHGGSLTLANRSSGGLEARLVLPRLQSVTIAYGAADTRAVD